jgi:acyl carrier protein
MEERIREFLAANFFLGDDPSQLNGSTSLIEAGVIDSTGVLELVGFLEEEFEIRIADEDLVPENLDSVDNIIRFVEGKRAGQ